MAHVIYDNNATCQAIQSMTMIPHISKHRLYNSATEVSTMIRLQDPFTDLTLQLISRILFYYKIIYTAPYLLAIIYNPYLIGRAWTLPLG